VINPVNPPSLSCTNVGYDKLWRFSFHFSNNSNEGTFQFVVRVYSKQFLCTYSHLTHIILNLLLYSPVRFSLSQEKAVFICGNIFSYLNVKLSPLPSIFEERNQRVSLNMYLYLFSELLPVKRLKHFYHQVRYSNIFRMHSPFRYKQWNHFVSTDYKDALQWTRAHFCH
jgi:hypothetical protein